MCKPLPLKSAASEPFFRGLQDMQAAQRLTPHGLLINRAPERTYPQVVIERTLRKVASAIQAK